MGFWQGLNAGLKAVQEEKTRKQERQEEIDLRRQEIEEQRKYERETFMLQTAEARRDKLFGLFAAREQERAEAGALTGKAQAFFTRLGDVDDPRVAALARNAKAAAALEDEIRALEIEAKKAGIETPALQGQALLDFLTVYDPGTDTVQPLSVSIEDLEQMDLSDRTNYERLALELTQPTPLPSATLSPEAYRRFDPEVLKEGRQAFDQEVLRLATDALNAAGDDPKADEKLRPLIEGYGKEGSGERFALMDMFGQQAFANLAATDNPYIQDLENDPALSRYSTMAQLNRVINDPEATEEERMKAQELLERLR